jgi:hypothetical protein
MSLPEPKPFHGQMAVHDFSLLVNAMRLRGVKFQPGLDEGELANIEQENGFVFPSDLKDLLKIAVPHPCHGFTDWRRDSPTPLADVLRGKAAETICWQLTYCNLPWPKEFGERPSEPDAMFAQVHEIFSTAPVMVPLLDRRFYLPCEPKRAGNPIFVISSSNHFALSYAAFDLSQFLIKRCALPECIGAKPFPGRIRFWQQFIKGKLE